MVSPRGGSSPSPCPWRTHRSVCPRRGSPASTAPRRLRPGRRERRPASRREERLEVGPTLELCLQACWSAPSATEGSRRPRRWSVLPFRFATCAGRRWRRSSCRCGAWSVIVRRSCRGFPWRLLICPRAERRRGVDLSVGVSGLTSISAAGHGRQQQAVPHGRTGLHLDDLEAGIAESLQPSCGPIRRGRIGVRPRRVARGHRSFGAGTEIANVLVVEAAQQPDRGVPMSRTGAAEEELVEFAIEQRPIKERVAEHEPVAAEPGCPASQPSAVPKPGTRRPAMNDLNFQLTPVDCSVSIRPSARRRASPARAWRAISPPLSWPTTATSLRSSRSTARRRLWMWFSIVSGVSAVNWLEPAPGRSMRWQVTWSVRWGSSVRKVAPLTGHPWTNSTSGPSPTRR